MNESWWQKQESGKPLFPDILWSKPENRDFAGRLAIIGGNAHSFAGVALAYKTALTVGVGKVRVIMPDVLKKVVCNTENPSRHPELVSGSIRFRNKFGMTIKNDDCFFAPSNPSGGLSKEALPNLYAVAEWADAMLFIGDSGQNSETAALAETFLSQDQTTPVVITRDAVDLVKNIGENLLNRGATHLIVSLNQLQKIFQSVYYPRVVMFSQGVKQVAETLHKFTTTYPVMLTLWHGENLFVAHGGRVITQPFAQPLRIWSGELAVRQTAWQIWNPKKTVEAIVTSWTEM
ncbi:MAG: hypothetical protein LBM09_00425 [Candidatus Nomurabacteria bacterium]|jgi:hypothetical protein|nr:hypothetical protein [Candidatus Nomurabacteria bacterium]